jgi:hypothetical protein
MKADFHNYVEQETDKETAQEKIRTFQQFVQSAGWAATVRIPPAAESASRKRAEKTIMTAINLLRLVIGIPHSQDMRLAHFAGSPIHTQYASHEGRRLIFTTNRKLSGALVTADWHAIFQHIPEFWHRANHLLSVNVEGKRSEMANRVIDALSWFGEAAFETEPGTKIAKFVAALERLVTTHKFSPHMFCTRVALLTRDPNSDNFEDCYWEADEVYSARCEIMHGASSPTDPKFLRHLFLAHNVTRTAIFRALEIHCVLDDNNGTSTVTDLNNYFVSEQSKFAPKMGKLKTEIKKRKISKFQSQQQRIRI